MLHSMNGLINERLIYDDVKTRNANFLKPANIDNGLGENDG